MQISLRSLLHSVKHDFVLEDFFFNISSIYWKLDCGYILAVFTTIFKFQMIHPVILKVHSFSLFLLPKMVLTNRIRLVLQHLHESFFWSRPHLKDTRWSTRWSKILWRSPRQTWRSWGERAKARMRTSTRTRKARWDELKKTKKTNNSYRHMTHRTHMRFLWHTWACSYNEPHSQTLTPETCSQRSKSYWQYVKHLVCAVVQKLLVCLGFLASFIFFKNTPAQGPLTPSCSTRMSNYKSCQTHAQTRKQASTNSSGYRSDIWLGNAKVNQATLWEVETLLHFFVLLCI